MRARVHALRFAMCELRSRHAAVEKILSFDSVDTCSMPGRERQRPPTKLVKPQSRPRCIWRSRLAKAPSARHVASPHRAPDRQLLRSRGSVALQYKRDMGVGVAADFVIILLARFKLCLSCELMHFRWQRSIRQWSRTTRSRSKRFGLQLRPR